MDFKTFIIFMNNVESFFLHFFSFVNFDIRLK